MKKRINRSFILIALLAICMLQEKEEGVEPHAYVNELKQEDNVDFKGKVAAYRERYVLP